MPLLDELDRTIRGIRSELADLEASLDALKREIAVRRQVELDALRLYRSAAGTHHALDGAVPESSRERPREEQVLAALEAAGRPVTLGELVDAMPDNPDRGAISAVIHRAVKRGDVQRLDRGVYELVGRLSRAS